MQELDFLFNKISTSYLLMLAMREPQEKRKYWRGQQEQEITVFWFFS